MKRRHILRPKLHSAPKSVLIVDLAPCSPVVARLRRLRPRRAPSCVRRSSISRPKSRFVEAPTPPRASAAPASLNQTPRCASVSTPHGPASQIQRPRCAAVSSPHTPADPDDDEDLFRRAGAPASASAARCQGRAAVGLQLAVLVLFLAILLVSQRVGPPRARARPSPTSLVVMVGNVFRAWTNDRLHAPFHRITVSGDVTRYSAILFSVPNFRIQAPDELVDEEHPPRFKPHDNNDYIRFCVSEEGARHEEKLKAYCGV